MSTKIIVAIVAALGLGFAGTYFATSSGGSCNGGCPISNLLGFGSDSASGKGDCCHPASDCCDPPSACCGSAAKAKSSCCVPGAVCCEPGAACCEDKAGKTEVKSDKKTEPVSTDAK